MKDYKDTVLMMKTDFPMRGNLGVNEHNIQKYWKTFKDILILILYVIWHN